MQKITPHLWFDTQAPEAAEFYTSAFREVFESEAEQSRIKNTATIHNTPSGSVDIVTIDLLGYEFQMISAGPLFTFNPSISFVVACRTEAEVDALWEKLSPGSISLMELGAYPFSKRYAWLQDRFGLSWQIMFMGEIPVTQRIIPVTMFVGKVYGQARSAVEFYTSLFPNSEIGMVLEYGEGEEPDKAGTIKHVNFALAGQKFGAMDSALPHDFGFNEAISFIVHCDTQEEIDFYWEKLSAVPEAEQCGWLKDKFGLSWQIVPTSMDEIMNQNDPEKIDRVTQAFLKMKKFDIAKLKEAADSK